MTSSLRGTPVPLYEEHDVALLDLDGVVYVGADAVPGVPEALSAVAEHGMRLAYVTNNAARPPRDVAVHLAELGIAAGADDVITSAQAAARYLAEQLGPGAQVLVVGTTGLVEALSELGLKPVWQAADDVQAVVQGYSSTTNWRMLAEAAVMIGKGVIWVATNGDPTVPSPRGPLPGNGSLVAALRYATHAEPVVTGKPDPTMHRETLLRTHAERPIVVGDRLDTDIEGANEVGCPSLLVLSGVTAAADLLAAPPKLRPTYLGADVSGLLEAQPQPEVGPSSAVCGRWTATWTEGGLELGSRSSPARPTDGETRMARSAAQRSESADDLDAVRALCAAQWSRFDGDAGQPARRMRVGFDRDDPAAEAVLGRLGLA